MDIQIECSSMDLNSNDANSTTEFVSPVTCTINNEQTPLLPKVWVIMLNQIIISIKCLNNCDFVLQLFMLIRMKQSKRDILFHAGLSLQYLHFLVPIVRIWFEQQCQLQSFQWKRFELLIILFIISWSYIELWNDLIEW